MPSPNFESLSDICHQSEGQFLWDVPDGWQQGRGAFGGLVLAAMVRAAEQAVDEDLELRTLSAVLCGPAMVGPAVIDVTRLRVGSSTTTATISLSQTGQVRAHATAFFGRPRIDGGDWTDMTPPVVPPWSEVPVLRAAPPQFPVFAQHIEFRPLSPPPVSGTTRTDVLSWVRLPRPGDLSPAALTVALADTLWPVQLPRMTQLRPMATVSFTIEFLSGSKGFSAVEPVLYRAISAAGAGGYATEMRELWTPDGRLVALNQQTFAIIK